MELGRWLCHFKTCPLSLAKPQVGQMALPTCPLSALVSKIVLFLDLGAWEPCQRPHVLEGTGHVCILIAVYLGSCVWKQYF